jgi:hypothetical protein
MASWKRREGGGLCAAEIAAPRISAPKSGLALVNVLSKDGRPGQAAGRFASHHDTVRAWPVLLPFQPPGFRYPTSSINRSLKTSTAKAWLLGIGIIDRDTDLRVPIPYLAVCED